MFLGTIGICTTAIRITFEIYDKKTWTQEAGKRGSHDNEKKE